MAKINIYLPSLGEGVTEATITKWLKNKGEKIEKDEAIVEIATDKVDSEIPATETGILSELKYNEGDTVQVNEIIAIIENDKPEKNPVSNDTSENETTKVNNTPDNNKKKIINTDEIVTNKSHLTPSGKFLSPLVRKIAEKEKISNTDLDNITGTGFNNRLTKNDILKYINKKEKTTEENTTTNQQLQSETTGNYDIIEMHRMRKLIADHMVNSKRISPHVTSFIEADVTDLVNWRNKIKDEFQEKYNEKLTFTPIFVEAVAKALKKYPLVNVSVQDDKILVKKDINIGMATATDTGDLIVPVIKSADLLNLAGIAKQVNDLAKRARNNKLKPNEITEGTFTITNLGAFGSLTGTPIINQPQVAILATGAIKKKPAVVETPNGDFIGIRHILMLSLAYDHRVVDGALGGNFLKFIADFLENFDIKKIV